MGACKIENHDVQGWPAITLSNRRIAITVLPTKGADIYSFVESKSGVDALAKTPWGLQPPAAQPRAGSEGAAFLHNYEGGWQELFPNTFLPSSYKGRDIPLHGEVANKPWRVEIMRNDGDVAEISLHVTCDRLPLRLARRMVLNDESSSIDIQETVTNESEERVPFVWGHHPLLGAPFIEQDCRINVGDCRVKTIAAAEPETATLAPGQNVVWPYAKKINGTTADLREISGSQAQSHDHAYLTDFKRGWVEVENRRLGLAFSLEWDPSIFRWLVNWRPFGGVRTPPLDGIYGLALELWSTHSNLTDALADGDAHWLDPGTRRSTSIRATFRDIRATTE